MSTMNENTLYFHKPLVLFVDIVISLLSVSFYKDYTDGSELID